MRALLVIALLAGCAGAGATSSPAAEAPPPEPADPRVLHLRTMTSSLGVLAADVARITEAAPASAERCAELAGTLVAWGDAHYEAYEIADAEGSYLGLTDADTGNPELVELARTLARTSSQLVELVDEDCLYGSGAYGEALFEYLVAYQGLAHWVREGDPSAWDYETLIGA